MTLLARQTYSLEPRTAVTAIIVLDGAATMEDGSSSWIAPTGHALIVPAGDRVRIKAHRTCELRIASAEGEQAEEVRLLRMTPLLCAIARHDAMTGDTPSIRALFMDELRRSELARPGVRLPHDPRAHWVAQAVLEDPADPRSLEEFAASSGSSRRTLLRLFTAQTGLSFREFRQHARIYRSLAMLADGESVRDTGFDVGYESTPAFIAAFGQIMGTTPARYRRDLHNRSVRPCAVSARTC